ncbi:hypothetical protein E1264_38970 [Actinomadura sp. KC216]|uniref:hypothetical protein n=1 Tax=Actinomadura sp. KC216 TaxID=2530370 RepID=UPI001047D749|nr:hypothetical protein [Actinomadura sp. KC216]TDB76125.1 hypothetical protein E1264_38970 [Actinomadura sp. KC216]
MIDADRTLVLYGEGAREAARRMLPGLPDARFVPAGASGEPGPARLRAAFKEAVRAELAQVVLVAGMAEQARFLGGVWGVAGVLESITLDMGGDAALAATVAEAPTLRDAYDRWEAAGVLGPCGREMCRRTAGELERLAAEAAGTPASPVAAQVVMLDPQGERMVGMYGRMAR